MALLNAQNDIERLKQSIDLTRLPEHVAIIMDGNGRWARERGLFRVQGHQRGYQTVRQIVRDAGEIGIKVLNLVTNKLVRILGKVENTERFLGISLYQVWRGFIIIIIIIAPS